MANQQNGALSRRGFIHTASAGTVATLLQGTLSANAQDEGSTNNKPIRWGFVGTGGIANSMAKSLKNAPNATLTASSSRTLSKAEEFAKKHKAEKAYGSWAEMFKWDGIDAVYVATPTSVKEEISIAAAKAGKHVLCEKPLPSLASVKKIIAACRENNVAFMDGTHFSHHPRSLEIENNLDEVVGTRRSIDSVFQFNLKDKTNIRYNPKFEPMGAIGDAGWYNMRAIVDYIHPEAKVKMVSAFLRRDPETNAAVTGTGVITFDEGSSASFTCSIDAVSSRCEAEVAGEKASVLIPRFLMNDKDNSASYSVTTKGKKGSNTVKVESPRHGSAMMFEDFTAQAHDPSLRKKWETKAERTQKLLDLFWESAIVNEL